MSFILGFDNLNIILSHFTALNLLVTCSRTRIRVRMSAVSHVTGHLNIVIRKLAQLSIIRAKLFLLGRDAQGQTRNEVEKEE